MYYLYKYAEAEFYGGVGVVDGVLLDAVLEVTAGSFRTFVDIGTGYYTPEQGSLAFEIARRRGCEESVRIEGFEPHPEVFANTRRHFSAATSPGAWASCVTLHRMAVTDAWLSVELAFLLCCRVLGPELSSLRPDPSQMLNLVK